MPRVPRFLGHVNGIARPQPQQEVLLGAIVIGVAHGIWCDHEEAVASEAQTHEPLVGLLAHIAMHHHGIPRSVKVQNGGLRLGLREQCFEEVGDVRGKLEGRLVRVYPVGPVVLAAKRYPVKAFLQDLLDR